ncbi:MAG: hypothetical protein K0R28_1682 [Paenibacillus sp.]|jgi:hypothetical protein|nr:hypothetical protein [Paenibacillus sp.]
MGYSIVDADSREEWNAYLGQIHNADIYFTPEYCKIYEENGEGKAQLFVYTDGDCFICYPYLLRTINDLPWIKPMAISEQLYDIITPYGYGGPLCNAHDPDIREKLFEGFSETFGRYCREHNIVSEFVRFHPFLQNDQDYRAVNPVYSKNTIYIDLTQTEEEINKNFKPDNRNRIRRAHKAGLNVIHSDALEMDELIRLYYTTMDKKQATSYYYFCESFFRNTANFLAGNIRLIEVKYGEKVIVSALFMHYNKYVHYHLMGANKDFLPLAPVNLLISEAIKWAKSQGYHYLHLGGGYNGNDNLFKFKKTFNESATLDYIIGRKIHLPGVYKTLVRHLEMLPDQDYFPLYRHPANATKTLMVSASRVP